MVSLLPPSMTLVGLRRVTAFARRDSFIRPQVRGKKKLVKHAPVKVRLLTDVVRYGRRGI